MPIAIQGQLNERERQLLVEAITQAEPKPETVIEVGTWLGGGSTLHILRALEKNGKGHLWGIEADRSIYDRMLANIRESAPLESQRFSPLFGFSQQVLKTWIAKQDARMRIDFAFLDGGNNPQEQIDEFSILDPLMAHDAKLRKGKWLVPYLSRLDHWSCKLYDVSDEGLFYARKIALNPSPRSLKSARQHLLRLQLEPAEIAARFLPSRVCGLVLRLMPQRLSKALSDGRK